MEDHQKSNDHQTAMIAPVLEKDMKNAEKNAHSECREISEFDFDSALELYRKQRKRKIAN